ncbi:MAG: Crp/Fnr family transcriptional regulator [Chloroflexi bacterium]|nr:Crp/Fnr family transcriptional regulator [Chloroflexota bacterium]
MRSEELRALPYFARLDQQALGVIALVVQELPANRGEVLFHEGDPSRGLYFLVRGTVKISRISPEGREQVLLIVGPGQTFNEVPVFDDGPCPATATALEPSLLGLIPTDVVRRLVQQYPPVAEGVLRVFAARLRGLAGLVADLTHLDVTGRVAKFLLTYHTSSGQQSLRLTQQDLASIVGATREVVARTLRHLEEQGCILREGGGVELTSPEKLEAVLNSSAR